MKNHSVFGEKKFSPLYHRIFIKMGAKTRIKTNMAKKSSFILIIISIKSTNENAVQQTFQH